VQQEAERWAGNPGGEEDGEREALRGPGGERGVTSS
jgi:hypothetical protein